MPIRLISRIADVDVNQLLAHFAPWGIGLSALLLVLSFAGNIWLPLDILSHLRGYFIALVIAFVLIHCWPDWSLLLLAICLGSSVMAYSLAGYLTGPIGDPGANADMARIKILSLNTWKNQLDLARAEQVVRAADADVVILAELSNKRLALLERLSDLYPHQTRCTKGCWMALLSKGPWNTSGSQPRIKRQARMIWATYGSAKRQLNVIGIHMTNPLDSTADQALDIESLGAKIQSIDGPTIVAGDMNATPWSKLYKRIPEATGLRDLSHRMPSWPSAFWLPVQLPIDHFFVSDDIAVERVELGNRVGSDHLPLIGEFRLPD